MENVVNVEQISQTQNVHILINKDIMGYNIMKNVQNVEQKSQVVDKIIHMEQQQVMKMEHIAKNVQVVHILEQNTVAM